MRKILLTIASALVCARGLCEARFPKPDFTSGYQYPEITHGVPMEQLWNVVDVVLLVAMMSGVVWAAYRRRSRAVIYSTSIISVLYFGFFRSGCVCSIGSIQNVTLALTDPSYHLPWYVILIFLLPIVFTLLFGRVFCAGVCPLGALQELINVRNLRISKAVAATLGIIPWVYLAFTILYAATRSQFLICRFDPFVGIFRLGGDLGIIVFGIALLVMSVFVGRPFCQYLCPYGAVLSIFASLSYKKLRITDKTCINCGLCIRSCPVDAICTPQKSKMKEARMTGVKRIIVFAILLPLFTIAGAFLVGKNSDALSKAHKSVYLYEQISEIRGERLGVRVKGKVESGKRGQKTLTSNPSTLTSPPTQGDSGGLLNSTPSTLNSTPSTLNSLEVETFNAQGRSIEELKAEVDIIRHQYSIYSYLAGALIGFVIGFKLLKLSLKRSRNTYEIDSARCTMCGKCFEYCPQKSLTKPSQREGC